jgi:thymidylate synthase
MTSAKIHPEQQYLDLLKDILENGEEQIDYGEGVKTYSVFGRQIRFDLADGFPLLTTKKVYWKGVLYELMWFMKGMTNIKYLVDHNVHIWDDYPFRLYNEQLKAGVAGLPELTKDEFIENIKNDEAFAAKHGELEHIYGELWRSWTAYDGSRIDQLQWAIDELKKDPCAHNTIVNSWNPSYLYSMAPNNSGVRFPICHNMYQLNMKHGKLCLQLYQRSADIFLGVPFNIASYALLTVIIAKILGVEPGEFVHTFGDVHIYENHRDQVNEQLSRAPRPFPTLKIEGAVENIDAIMPEQLVLEGYDPHPPIKAELSVVGGYVQESKKSA